jgi:hypothetical protein
MQTLSEACVATGMKTGVSTHPCGRRIRLARAPVRAHTATTSNVSAGDVNVLTNAAFSGSVVVVIVYNLHSAAFATHVWEVKY